MPAPRVPRRAPRVPCALAGILLGSFLAKGCGLESKGGAPAEGHPAKSGPAGKDTNGGAAGGDKAKGPNAGPSKAMGPADMLELPPPSSNLLDANHDPPFDPYGEIVGERYFELDAPTVAVRTGPFVTMRTSTGADYASAGSVALPTEKSLDSFHAVAGRLYVLANDGTLFGFGSAANAWTPIPQPEPSAGTRFVHAQKVGGRVLVVSVAPKVGDVARYSFSFYKPDAQGTLVKEDGFEDDFAPRFSSRLAIDATEDAVAACGEGDSAGVPVCRVKEKVAGAWKDRCVIASAAAPWMGAKASSLSASIAQIQVTPYGLLVSVDSISTAVLHALGSCAAGGKGTDHTLRSPGCKDDPSRPCAQPSFGYRLAYKDGILAVTTNAKGTLGRAGGSGSPFLFSGRGSVVVFRWNGSAFVPVREYLPKGEPERLNQVRFGAELAFDGDALRVMSRGHNKEALTKHAEYVKKTLDASSAEGRADVVFPADLIPPRLYSIPLKEIPGG